MLLQLCVCVCVKLHYISWTQSPPLKWSVLTRGNCTIRQWPLMVRGFGQVILPPPPPPRERKRDRNDGMPESHWMQTAKGHVHEWSVGRWAIKLLLYLFVLCFLFVTCIRTPIIGPIEPSNSSVLSSGFFVICYHSPSHVDRLCSLVNILTFSIRSHTLMSLLSSTLLAAAYRTYVGPNKFRGNNNNNNNKSHLWWMTTFFFGGTFGATETGAN